MAIRTHLVTAGLVLTLALGPAPSAVNARADAEKPLSPKAKPKKIKAKWENLIKDLAKYPVHSPRALAVDPGDTRRLYVGTYGAHGGWRSTDRGKSWSRMDDLPRYGTRYTAMLVCPGNSSVVLAANDNAGLFRSTDAGNTWAPLGAKNGIDFAPKSHVPSGSPAAYALAALATNPPTLVAWLADDKSIGTYRSVDSGQTWTRCAPFDDSGHPRMLAAAPGDPNTIYALTSCSLFRSRDAAKTWTKLASPTPAAFEAIVVHPTDPNVLYIADWSKGVFRSADGGASWVCSSAGLPTTTENGVCSVFLHALAIDPTNPSILYAGGNGAFSTSSDAGATWNEMAGTKALAIVVDPNDHNTVYVCDYTTVWRCTIKGR